MLITVVVGGGVFIWFVVHQINTGGFLRKIHQIEAGMSLKQAVTILGKPTQQRESSERFLNHDERPKDIKLGESNPLIYVTWDGPGFKFGAYVVNGEIIATRVKRKGPKM